MIVTKTDLPEVLLVQPTVHGDDRGFFVETYHAGRYRDAGITESFVQDNLSFSRRGVLRGLHFQEPHAQGKLVQVLLGEVWDVAVDVRAGSPRFGRWVGVSLSSTNKHQLYLPPGFAHGFVVVSDEALFQYKCTSPYDPSAERSVLWNDPALAIEWPMRDVIVSAKDDAAPALRAIPAHQLPAFA